MNKRGRPLKEDSKCNQYRLRMTEKDFEMLAYMANKKGLSKADIIRNSLHMYYTNNLLLYTFFQALNQAFQNILTLLAEI